MRSYPNRVPLHPPIHNNFLLLQQTAKQKLLPNRKEPRWFIKLDASKDSTPYRVVFLTLIGFGRRWCSLLCILLSRSTSKTLFI